MISSFIATLQKKDLAQRISNDRPYLYRKKGWYGMADPKVERKECKEKTVTQANNLLPKEVSYIEIVEAMILYLESLKSEIADKDREIKERTNELMSERELRNEVEKDYRNAQQKILELNQRLASGAKTFSLHEIQQFRDGLPRRELS